MNPFATLSRMLVSIALVTLVLWSWDSYTLFGKHGLINPAVLAASSSTAPLAIWRVVAPGSDVAMQLLSTLISVTAISLCWLFVRPSSPGAGISAYLTFLCLTQSISLVSYGVYAFLQIGFFYVMAETLATRWCRDPDSAVRSSMIVGKWFRLHIAMTYCFAGLSKAIGPQWWTGESMWRVVAGSRGENMALIDLTWMGAFPWLLQALGIGVVLLESLYPLVFLRRVRTPLVWSVIAMHVGIGLFQGLIMFALAMIALNLFVLMDARRSESSMSPESAPATTAEPGVA